MPDTLSDSLKFMAVIWAAWLVGAIPGLAISKGSPLVVGILIGGWLMSFAMLTANYMVQKSKRKSP